MNSRADAALLNPPASAVVAQRTPPKTSKWPFRVIPSDGFPQRAFGTMFDQWPSTALKPTG